MTEAQRKVNEIIQKYVSPYRSDIRSEDIAKEICSLFQPEFKYGDIVRTVCGKKAQVIKSRIDHHYWLKFLADGQEEGGYGSELVLVEPKVSVGASNG